MNILALIIFFSLTYIVQSEITPPAYGYDGAMRAAYFGESEKLREMFDPKANPTKIGITNPSVLIGYAMASNHKDAVKVILKSGWPKYPSQLKGVFTNRHMTPEMVTVFVENIPDFREKFGVLSLGQSIAAGNVDVAKKLILAGVPLNDGRRSPLKIAVQMRDAASIELLMNNGADPYAGSRTQRPVDIAVTLRSHALLGKLDTKGEFKDLSDELGKNLPQNSSKFPGLWVYRPSGGGFGTMALRLFADGTGTMAGDVGALPVMWKHISDTVVHLNPTTSYMKSLGDRAKKVELNLTMNSIGELLLDKAGEKKTLKREKLGAQRKSKWTYPIFIRMEKVWITPDEGLILQINGMRKHVSIHQIVKGAKQSTYHKEPNEFNVLLWDSFKQIGKVSIPTGSLEIVFGERKVSPGYSRHWDQLGFNHKELVVLKEGVDQRIFQLTGSERYHGGEANQYGHQVLGWALMRKQKFPHDRDWIAFYLLKSSKNIYAEQDAAPNH